MFCFPVTLPFPGLIFWQVCESSNVIGSIWMNWGSSAGVLTSMELYVCLQ